MKNLLKLLNEILASSYKIVKLTHNERVIYSFTNKEDLHNWLSSLLLLRKGEVNSKNIQDDTTNSAYMGLHPNVNEWKIEIVESNISTAEQAKEKSRALQQETGGYVSTKGGRGKEGKKGDKIDVHRNQILNYNNKTYINQAVWATNKLYKNHIKVDLKDQIKIQGKSYILVKSRNIHEI